MRCKKHVIDPTSGVGVCASCLRERLFSILAAQSQDQSPPSISLTTPQCSVPTYNKREKRPSASSLFRSRLKHAAATSSHPPSWLSGLFSTKKGSAGGRRQDVAGGGMSPASDCGDPPPPPPGRGGGGGGMRLGEVAGFVFCISPLIVRARPKRRSRNSKSMPPEAAVKPRLEAAAASFCTNRSRKVADFGKERAKW